MPLNSLTREAGFKIGPLILETAVKHYFERILKDNDDLQDKAGESETTRLRRDEFLYDEAFSIAKTFLEAASKHTVEELQEFSNMRTPSPPWVHVVKTCVPMSCCDEAGIHLIKALGGEETTKRVVGGTKWWQVRGVAGVDGEWIASKKDWEEAKKRSKLHEKKMSAMTPSSSEASSAGPSKPGVPADASSQYQPEMDEMRCILYIHGGGYYFGSVDQERYSIQRHARKINGRVFAVNYRLAPQYPFPCAIQDILAAYLFLIQPPEGSSHRPVNPAHIVVAGDSAGGGLSIALLQVLRDAGLPMPAGGVLISPWCDLTHCFPSIHTNTATDVMPAYGLSLYKPSTLWPPPSDDLTKTVQASVRSRIMQAVRSRKARSNSTHTLTQSPTSPGADVQLPPTGRTLHLGSTASLPATSGPAASRAVSCTASSGEILTIADQIHLYAPNHLLSHPLVSSVLSYMGGLPPLFFVASDKEVLRDEIIYIAHKAAHPEKYPITDEARKAYPALEGIEMRHGPTKVHLQVYDDAAHVLPVLFSFTTPAKYCYRAIATFTKYVTGMVLAMPSDVNIGDIPMVQSPQDTDGSATTFFATANTSPTGSMPIVPEGAEPQVHSSPHLPSTNGNTHHRIRSWWSPRTSVDDSCSGSGSNEGVQRRSSFRRALSRVSRVPMALSSSPNGSYFSAKKESTKSRSGGISEGSVDVAGPRFHHKVDSLNKQYDFRIAGESSVYDHGLDVMIRERVATHGVIRPLEPENELSAFALPADLIGVISEHAMRRYLDGKVKFDRKFHKVAETVQKHRDRNLEAASKDAMRNITQLQSHFAAEREKRAESGTVGTPKSFGPLPASGSWNWAWALDADEHPPPSSIVSRRDTDEAVRLARVADQSVLSGEGMLSGNSLWSMIANFLTVVPDKNHERHQPHHHPEPKEGEEQHEGKSVPKRERFRSRFAHFVAVHKKMVSWRSGDAHSNVEA